jgi:hypothetical protein
MRKILVIGLILLLGVPVAQAQEEPAEFELIQVLLMGAEVFEPDVWYASGSETASTTSAIWQPRPSAGFSGISGLSYLHFDTGYTLDGLDEFFDDTWFDQTFVNWQDLRKTNLCFDDEITLHEFTLAFQDSRDNVTRYAMRYWVEPMDDTRVRAWYIIIATTFADGTTDPEGRTRLDDYAARLYPNFVSCPR